MLKIYHLVKYEVSSQIHQRNACGTEAGEHCIELAEGGRWEDVRLEKGS